MSLVNDALKRARQAQQKHSPPPVPVAPLRPVDVARPRRAGPGIWLPLALAAVLVLVFVVALAVGRGGAGKTVAPATTPETRTSPGVAASAPTRTLGATEPKPEPASATVVAPAGSPAAGLATPTPPPPETTTVPAVVAETPPAVPAWPKLQGIFYRPDSPSVLLNGKTVLIGEHSGDCLVVAIDRQSVTLVRAGVTNVSRLTE